MAPVSAQQTVNGDVDAAAGNQRRRTVGERAVYFYTKTSNRDVIIFYICKKKYTLQQSDIHDC